MKNSKVVILGASYKGNVGDARETPARRIAKELKEKMADVWLVDSLVEKELLDQWGKSPRVRFCSPPTNPEVLALCAQSDVFVLPTRFEGFPVSLLEAMSAGLEPVVSDLPSGIPEVVSTEPRPVCGDSIPTTKKIPGGRLIWASPRPLIA